MYVRSSTSAAIERAIALANICTTYVPWAVTSSTSAPLDVVVAGQYVRETVV